MMFRSFRTSGPERSENLLSVAGAELLSVVGHTDESAAFDRAGLSSLTALTADAIDAAIGYSRLLGERSLS